MKPEQLSIEDQAAEYRRQHAALAALGLVLRFSDTPPAVALLPISADAGVQEVLHCRALGREFLAYAEQCESRLPQGAMVTQRTEAPPPPAAAGGDRLAMMEAQLAALIRLQQAKADPAAQVPMAPGPDPYQYVGTTPTPNEHRPAPVAPR